MRVLSILSTLRAEIASWNVWRKMIRKRRKPKRKGLGFSWSSSLLHLEKHTLWGPMERNPNCWSPSPMNSWPDGCKNKDLDCTNVSLNWVELLCPNSVGNVFSNLVFFLPERCKIVVQYFLINCQILFIKYFYFLENSLLNPCWGGYNEWTIKIICYVIGKFRKSWLFLTAS